MWRDQASEGSDWRSSALCSDMGHELFFRSGPVHTEVRLACAQCPVAQQCLEAQLAFEGDAYADYRYGVFAGVTPNARYLMHKGEIPIEPDRTMPNMSKKAISKRSSAARAAERKRTEAQRVRDRRRSEMDPEKLEAVRAENREAARRWRERQKEAASSRPQEASAA